MENLVIIKNGQAVTDSLTVAEVFGKRHDSVMRDIRNQIEKLAEANELEFTLHNFVEREYQTGRNNSYIKFDLTEDAFALVVMAYTTPEAMKFKVKFLQEFKRIKEQLSQPRQLSEREQLMASMKLSIETAEEIATVKEDVIQLKDQVNNQMTIDHGQQVVILATKNKRVEKLWSERQINTEFFDNKRKVHAQAWRDLKLAFGVASYRDIKKKDYEEALAFVKAWRPRMF
ncbi:Rha family transcriptional regulator [Priestia flexa]|uniref:Rha family transcriptional regulator n=1 Tax=Priestia flexa TaxID=86664 RepID=UPI001F4D251F|nr:Rha family transcriptional regulator [Priestia flexa]